MPGEFGWFIRESKRYWDYDAMPPARRARWWAFALLRAWPRYVLLRIKNWRSRR
jgi:hypothetical protein